MLVGAVKMYGILRLFEADDIRGRLKYQATKLLISKRDHGPI
jgi:hypothetical protein